MSKDRYYEDEPFEEDFFSEGDDEDYGQDEIDRTLEIEERYLNQKVLFNTIKYLKKSVVGWNTLGIDKQREIIKDQFKFYQLLLDGDYLDDLNDLEQEKD